MKKKRPTSILIVDDDRELSCNLRDILDAEGYDVSAAQDVGTALDLCHGKNFDLGLIDLRLAGMQGTELAGKMSGLLPGSEQIIMTGHASVDSAASAVGERNLVGYVTKPLAMEHLLGLIRQVSERRRLEEELRSRERLLAEAQRIANCGSWEFDVASDTMQWTEQMYRIFGISPGGFAHNTEGFLGLVHPGDRAAMTVWIGDILAGRRPAPLDFRINRPDGTVRHIRGGGEAIFDCAGKPLRLMGTAQDITERKLTEEAIVRSEERYRSLVAASPDGIVTVGADGLITFASQRIVELLGCQDANEIVGTSLLQWVPPEDRERAGADFRNLSAGGHFIHGPNLLSRKDGTSFWAEINNSLLNDVHGEPFGIISVIRDVTDRKLAEDRLKAQQELTEAVMATTPNGVAVVDKDRRVLLANRTFRTILNIELAAGLEGRRLDDIASVEGLSEAISRVVATGVAKLDLEFRWGAADTEKILVAQIVPMPERPSELLVVLRDVTDERAAQFQQYHTSALATIGEMASGIAHELNNPLTSIAGFSELILSRIELPEKAREYIEIIDRESHRSARIVKGLLAFARKQPMEKLPVDINEVVSNVLQLRSYEQKLNSIEAKTSLGSNLPKVAGNSSQLQQVFLNIIINAEYFMKEAHGRGILTIATERAGDVVRVTCTDDGPGIPREVIGRLFAPFFTTKPVGRGTGLGLGISHGIVTEHGGTICAESAPGKGATFVVEVPVLKEGAVQHGKR